MLMDGVDTDGAGGGGALVANDAYAGDGGGARLEVGGALTLANVTNAGKTASGSGGTVASQGDLSITGGSVTANTAGANGGGVFATEGMVGLEQVAITANGATDNGGGLAIASGATAFMFGGNAAYTGGGIYVIGAAVTLSNAAIHNNNAVLWGGGIRGHYGAIDISSSTITGNAVTGGDEFVEPGSGCGILLTSTAVGLSITNTIITGKAAMAGDDLLAADTPTGLRGVILGEAAQQWYGGALALVADHALVLANAGMTTADVFAAMDASGGGVVLANGGFGGTAARRFRLMRAARRADIGADQVPGTDVPSLVVIIGLDIVNDSDGLVSLREAVAWVNAGALTGTITFATGAGEAFEHLGALTLGGTELVISRDVSNNGTVGGYMQISGGFESRVFRVLDGGSLDHVIVTANEATCDPASPNGALYIIASDVVVTNTIIVGSIGAAWPDLAIEADAVAPFRADAIFLGSAEATQYCPTLAGTPGLIGVQVNTLSDTYDARGLPVLADNGGPVRTVALAVDAGNPALEAAFPVFGQQIDAYCNGAPDPFLLVGARDVARDWVSDAGAYEVPLDVASLVVIISADAVDACDGLVSLREAIGYVQSGLIAPGTITFAGETSATQIVLTGGVLVIDSDVSIDGGAIDFGGIFDGANGVEVNGSYFDRIFDVTGGTLSLTGMFLNQGKALLGSGIRVRRRRALDPRHRADRQQHRHPRRHDPVGAQHVFLRQRRHERRRRALCRRHGDHRRVRDDQQRGLWRLRRGAVARRLGRYDRCADPRQRGRERRQRRRRAGRRRDRIGRERHIAWQ